jgi:hypothetical protein
MRKIKDIATVVSEPLLVGRDVVPAIGGTVVAVPTSVA